MRKTPLFEAHQSLGARLVDFAGWSLPQSFGSAIEEHVAVRTAAGVFDVSHMPIFEAEGKDAMALFLWALSCDLRQAKPQHAAYGCMLNEAGGILDDVLAYPEAEESVRLVANAACEEKDFLWLSQIIASRGFDVKLRRYLDLAFVALQGPKAEDILASALGEWTRAIPPFGFTCQENFFVSRTGYTGEDGYEISLPSALAHEFFLTLMHKGAKPCGLAARDSLRVEAGFNLYGADMDESITPMESGLSKVVDFTGRRAFSGKPSLARQRPRFCRLGIILEEKAMMRRGAVVRAAAEGVVTSAVYSPMLSASIGFVRLPAGHGTGEAQVEVRGKWLAARVVKLPFVRRGRTKVR